jgi:hypothetical protein
MATMQRLRNEVCVQTNPRKSEVVGVLSCIHLSRSWEGNVRLRRGVYYHSCTYYLRLGFSLLCFSILLSAWLEAFKTWCLEREGCA